MRKISVLRAAPIEAEFSKGKKRKRIFPTSNVFIYPKTLIVKDQLKEATDEDLYR
ncbi:MAG TPA: hypothetical protein VGQ09_23445 [Chitinophagaceae bacterium]|jgi:hypothetical protein|nr:hypothetical protein [Chitinophagaceae bacterium]